LDINVDDEVTGQGQASWRPFWIIFPILAALVIGLAVVLSGWRVDRTVSTITRSEREAVERYVDLVSQELRQAAVDVCAFAQQNELHQYLATGDRSALALGASELITRMRLTKAYDHIRYIDLQGAEHMRVNLNEGAPASVPEDELQTKSQRYYVSELLETGSGEIYISPIDLNIENGNIELPFKPVMRFGTGVVTESGDVDGFIVINVLAKSMLNAIIAQSKFNYGNPMLINEEGYWLVDPTMPASWGFLYPEFAEDKMPVLYPEEWKLMNESETGSFRTQNGIFTFANYTPLREIGPCDASITMPPAGFEGTFRWMLASHVPASQLRAAGWQVSRQAILPTILALLLLALLTRAGTVELARRKVRHRLLEHQAKIDILTGLANRAAFEERLRVEAERAQKHGKKFAVILADLDGFKAVNDSLGHKAGDRVLKKVAQAFLESGRSTDTPARLGGDEFVVLLSDIPDAEAAYRIAQTLLARIGLIREGGLEVGASLGISIFPDHTTNPAEAIVFADHAMYAAKNSGKNKIVIHDEDTPPPPG